MCLLAIHFRSFAEAPLAAAANREEFFNRASLPPQLITAAAPGAPRVLCGVDALAGGTWLGVNERGLFVAVTNRPKTSVPLAPRSRGQLCLDLLACRSAEEASRRAVDELSTGRYAGANYVCVDSASGNVIHAGDQIERISLEPGLHLLANGDLDDPGDSRLNLARELFTARPSGTAVEFLAAAQQVCGHYLPGAGPGRPSIVLRAADRGTVSSTLVSLAAAPALAVYRYAAGPPDRTPFEDFSPLLRSLCDVSAK
ncbi:MAG TPA: NRDE family protein [Pirellulales bacterium]|nr:NRDE family protein [Pirellulales bacterium]